MSILAKALHRISSKAKELEVKVYDNYCKGLEAKHKKLLVKLMENDAKYQAWLEEQSEKNSTTEKC